MPASQPLTAEPDLDLDEIYAFAVQLGKDAGKMLMEAAQLRFDGSSPQDALVEKDSSVDIVTQTDEDVEAFIKTSIQTRYPTHLFIGEETYSKGDSRTYLVPSDSDSDSAAVPTWIVDPLDGTVNYTHLFPMFCVSIGVVVRGEPVIGVICAPFLNQTFTACRGRGAWLNETQRLPLIRNPQVPPMPKNAPSGCVFSCEWGKDRKDRPDGNLHRKVESFVNMAGRWVDAVGGAAWFMG